MKRIAIIVLFLAISLGIASAQDATTEPTAPAPIVVVTPAPSYISAENGISVSTLAYGVIIALLSGGTLAVVLTRFGSTKANVDALEKLYQSASPETQEIIRERFVELEGIVKRLLDIADKATDGKPNEDPPAQPTA